MFESMTKVVSQNELKVLVSKHLLTDAIGNNIEKACQGIYPLQNVCYKISQMKYFCWGGEEWERIEGLHILLYFYRCLHAKHFMSIA